VQERDLRATVLHGSDRARIVGPRARIQAMRTDFGRPSSNMRFKV
jgi:hypothetical protein